MKERIGRRREKACAAYPTVKQRNSTSEVPRRALRSHPKRKTT